MKRSKLTDHVWRLWRCVNDLTTEVRNVSAAVNKRLDEHAQWYEHQADIGRGELGLRIDAQARTIAELEKQIAGLRGSLDAQKAAMQFEFARINKAVFPAPDMVPAGDVVED